MADDVSGPFGEFIVPVWPTWASADLNFLLKILQQRYGDSKLSAPNALLNFWYYDIKLRRNDGIYINRTRGDVLRPCVITNIRPMYKSPIVGDIGRESLFYAFDSLFLCVLRLYIEVR